MAAVTAAQLKSSAANMLKFKDEDEMPAYYDDLCARASEYAYNEVKGGLLRRGFRLTEDIAQWDRLYEFTLDLGLWKVLILSGAYSGFDGATIQALDRRKELSDVLVFVNGTWVQVATGAPGTTTTAGPSKSDGGIFGYDDTQDNLGFDW